MPAPKRMNVPRRMNTAITPSMFPHTVALYNVEIYTDPSTFKDTVINHVTILRGVLLDESKAVNVRESGLEGADAANLYIPFDVVAIDGADAEAEDPPKKRYIPPVEFWRAEDKTGVWTLAISKKGASGDGYTFFVKGEALPPEGMKPELVADAVEASYDGVYHISKVDTKDFGGLQHFEVGGV